jgi:hypothetical protein
MASGEDSIDRGRTSPLPALACPVCGGPNACAPARSGTFETPCWCTAAVFPAALTGSLLPASAGRACICAACAAAAVAAETRRSGPGTAESPPPCPRPRSP